MNKSSSGFVQQGGDEAIHLREELGRFVLYILNTHF